MIAKREDTSSGNAYSGKNGQYFAGVRRDFVEALPVGSGFAVLEIGCGNGDTGAAALGEGRCSRYVGVEIFELAAEVAARKLSEVVHGDVEHIALPWQESTFDALLMSEVLEHLVDPWATLRRIGPLLKPGAIVVASSPNVSQFRMIRNLLADKWELTDVGLMDRTHLRWFTRASYRRMFEDADITVEQISPMAPPGPMGSVFNFVTLARFEHLTVQQIRIIGRRRG